MGNDSFTYTYSSSVNKEVQEIRKKYLPQEVSKLEKLKRLDRHVQRAGIIESLIPGIIGALIFGIGMCSGLGVIGGGMILSVILDVIGTVIMLPAYIIYRAVSKRTREKYVPQILRLAEQIEKGQD